MRNISRVDRIIAVGLVTLLVALLAVAVPQRSRPARAQSPVTSRSPHSLSAAASGTRPGGISSVAAPSTTAAAPSTVAPSTTAAPSTSTSPGATPVPVAGPVSAVGDSIMLDIQPYLEADIPGARVDGLVNRQFETGISVVQTERTAGALGAVLVIELGTNGTVTSSDFDAMMQAASGVKRVVFVNVDVPRSWEVPDNAELAAGVGRYPGVAVLADWYALSSGHPEWFTADQVHLQPAGAQALAHLVTQYT